MATYINDLNGTKIFYHAKMGDGPIPQSGDILRSELDWKADVLFAGDAM
jgi:hypothetical protein